MLDRRPGALARRVARAAPAPLVARVLYLRHYGRWLHLAHPRRFTEHIWAQKIGGDQARMAELSDKLRVKDHVAARIGAEFVTPTLWHGPALPPREERTWPLPFVLKANHGSRMNALIRHEADLDWDLLERRCAAWMARDWERRFQEDWYNRIERSLFVEPLLGDGGGDLTDYKIFVLRGRPRFVQVDTGRFSRHLRSFYDPDWVKQPFEMKHPMDPEPHPRPPHLDRMLEAAAELAREFPFVRVDFYDLPEGPRFGEMTFSPGAGLQGFRPDRHDLEWGAMMAEGPCTG